MRIELAIRIEPQTLADAAEHIAVLYRGIGEELRNPGSDDRHGRAAAGQEHGLNRALVQSRIGGRLAQPPTLNYRRPLKTGNIVQTSVNALLTRQSIFLRRDRPAGQAR